MYPPHGQPLGGQPSLRSLQWSSGCQRDADLPDATSSRPPFLRGWRFRQNGGRHQIRTPGRPPSESVGMPRSATPASWWRSTASRGPGSSSSRDIVTSDSGLWLSSADRRDELGVRPGLSISAGRSMRCQEHQASATELDVASKASIPKLMSFRKNWISNCEPETHTDRCRMKNPRSVPIFSGRGGGVGKRSG